MASYDSVAKLVDERVTDIICTCARHLTLSHTTSLSLIGEMWICQIEHLVDEELAGCHSKDCGQGLNVQAETSDQWYPQGSVLGLTLFNTFFAPWTIGSRASLPLKLSCVGQSTHWREGMSHRETLTLLADGSANLMELSEVQGPTPGLGQSVWMGNE